MQASISTLLSREYYFPDKTWGENIPLFMRAVGAHTERLSNLYFVFLFTLRAVVKAGDFLKTVPYDTGNKEDDDAVKKLIRQLVDMHLPANMDMDVFSPPASQAQGQVSHNYFTYGSVSGSYSDAMSGLFPTSSSSSSSSSSLDSSPSTSSQDQLVLSSAGNSSASGVCGDAVLTAVDQCRNAFDESQLFQVALLALMKQLMHKRKILMTWSVHRFRKA